MASFGDQAEEENWIGSNYYYNGVFWIGLRQYDGEGTEGQVSGSSFFIMLTAGLTYAVVCQRTEGHASRSVPTVYPFKIRKLFINAKSVKCFRKGNTSWPPKNFL